MEPRKCFSLAVLAFAAFGVEWSLGRAAHDLPALPSVAGRAAAITGDPGAFGGFAARPIFDARTLAGWDGDSERWRVEDGAITAEIPAGESLARNAFIFWEGEVHDFELELEFRLMGGPSANSGIQFRSRRLPGGDAAGYQADIDDGTTWLGRIYDEHGRALLVERGTRVSIAPDGRRWEDAFAPPSAFAAGTRQDEWRSYRISAKGPHIEIRIDGILHSVLDDHDATEAELSGRLAFQLHSGRGPAKVQFRNIRLTSLGRTESPPPATLEAARELTEATGEGDRGRDSPVLWHLRPNPAPLIPPAESEAQKVVAGMRVVHGFRAELIAAEPDVHQPVAFAIDPRGRLWVAEAHSYPTKQPEGAGKDRIVIFEDADGDGAFEKRSVFVEGLNLISGLELGFGGVWVGVAPELLFIPDRDEDDRPDGPPEVLLDGWGYQDTHETLNSLTWGPDGWLYGCQGVFVHSFVGKPGTPDQQRSELRSGIWRYHPVRHRFEIYAHGGSNQWGLDFNEAGHLFMTHPRSLHGGGGTSYVIRHGHYWNQTNSNYPSFISSRAPDFAPDLKNMLPASARFDTGEGGAGKPGANAVYGGHSNVGTMIYLGDNWPAIYRDHLFTINLHGRQLGHQHNERLGSGYETFHAGYDLLFVPEPSFLGIDVQFGPDGAAYLIDWCDLQRCHTLHDDKWDRTNGRIYRLAWAESYSPAQVDLAAQSDLELVRLHGHRNAWFGRTARRLLQERAAVRALDPVALAELRERGRSREAVPVLQAMWTLHATAMLDEGLLREALEHADDRVRAWAVSLAADAAENLRLSPSELAKIAARDPSPAVRLAVASALPLVPPGDRWEIITTLAARVEDAGDRFLPRMIWFALASIIPDDIDRGFAVSSRTVLPALADSIRWFIARTPRGRELLVKAVAEGAANDAERTLRLLAFSLRNESQLEMPDGWKRVRERFESHDEPELGSAVNQLAALFGDREIVARTRAVLADQTAKFADRREAFNLLQRIGDAEALPLYARLIDDPRFRSDVIPLLVGSRSPETAARILEHFPDLNEADRAAALNTLSSRTELAVALLEAVQGGRFDKTYLSSLHIRQMRSLGSPTVDRLLDHVWGAVADSSVDAREEMEGVKRIYLEAPRWAYDVRAGEAHYQQLCAPCHRMDGEGGTLGPDLTGSWRNGVDYFIENIVDPNAAVGIDYQLQIVTTKDGTVHSGMLEREAPEVLILRTLSETISIPAAQIQERQILTHSMMPPGLLDALNDRQMVELLKYLATRR